MKAVRGHHAGEAVQRSEERHHPAAHPPELDQNVLRSTSGRSVRGDVVYAPPLEQIAPGNGGPLLLPLGGSNRLGRVVLVEHVEAERDVEGGPVPVQSCAEVGALLHVDVEAAPGGGGGGIGGRRRRRSSATLRHLRHPRRRCRCRCRCRRCRRTPPSRSRSCGGGRPHLLPPLPHRPRHPQARGRDTFPSPRSPSPWRWPRTRPGRTWTWARRGWVLGRVRQLLLEDFAPRPPGQYRSRRTLGRRGRPPPCICCGAPV